MSGFENEALRDGPGPLTETQQVRFTDLQLACERMLAAISQVRLRGLGAQDRRLRSGGTTRTAMELAAGEFQAELQTCINAADLDAGTIGERRRREIARAMRQRAGGAA